jgi:hypothetical protein
MRSTILAFVAFALLPSVLGALRFPCSQLVTERFDPLVNPGLVSPHVHQVVGGNAFNISMDPTVDISEIATCTTCQFKEDKSNYWTAALYFRHPNGSYLRVPQMANHNTGPGIQAGGMTIYYFQPVPPTNNLEVVAFKKGFRMLVGDAMRRVDNIDPTMTASKALTFRCFNGTDPGPYGSPGTGPEDTVGFPAHTCSGGIRTNIFFPQCWDGINLDSPNHQSHVAHPAGTPNEADGLQFFGTECPNTHPIRLPLLFAEIVWDTRPFNDPSLWPADGSQPFLFSMGDPTGFGQHADYVFGWEGDSLQRAMEVCHDRPILDCPPLTLQDIDTMNNCRQSPMVPEIVEDSYIKELPGCNPIQRGPTPATLVPDCAAPSTTVAVPPPTTPPNVIIPPWDIPS